MTTIALKNVLAKAGLKTDPTEFLALVEDAAKRLTPPSPNPAHYFSPEQREALQDVGLDLAPASEDDRDARARAVAAHAVLADSALTVAEAATLLGVDDSRIRHRLKEGRLTGWKAQGGWRLPAAGRGRVHEHSPDRPGDQRKTGHAETVVVGGRRPRVRGRAGRRSRHARLNPGSRIG
jgi:excisionase family DNA binding protein